MLPRLTKESRVWQFVLAPPYEKEYKHWGKKIILCIVISGLLLTFWSFDV
jgi:hypothetical protein